MNKNQKKNHKVSYTVTMEYAELAESILIAYSSSGFEEKVLSDGSTVFTLYEERDADDTAWHESITKTLVKECNAHVDYSINDIVSWIELWKETCKPVHAGRFYIVPEWYTEDIPQEMYPIYITPRMAFGTGHHETTSLCLQALSSHYVNEYIQQGIFADIGTGSGILAIALAMLGMRGYAVDIDEVAIENAQENAEHNRVEKSLSLHVGDISSLPYNQLYRLVISNIISEVLLPLSSSIANIMEDKGICILSGILGIQMDSILQQYEKEGFICRERLDKGEWSACILEYHK